MHGAGHTCILFRFLFLSDSTPLSKYVLTFTSALMSKTVQKWNIWLRLYMEQIRRKRVSLPQQSFSKCSLTRIFTGYVKNKQIYFCKFTFTSALMSKTVQKWNIWLRLYMEQIRRKRVSLPQQSFSKCSLTRIFTGYVKNKQI